MLLNSIQINILSVPRSGTLNPVHNNCDDLPSIPEGVEAPTPWSNVPLNWDIQMIQTQLLSYIHINKHMSNHHWPVNTNGCGHSYRSTNHGSNSWPATALYVQLWYREIVEMYVHMCIIAVIYLWWNEWHTYYFVTKTFMKFGVF